MLAARAPALGWACHGAQRGPRRAPMAAARPAQGRPARVPAPRSGFQGSPIRRGLRCVRAADGDEPGSGGASSGSSGDDSGVQQEQAGAFAYSHIAQNLERMDANQLQTALATAIAAEDYALAAAIRDRFDSLMGSGGRLLDWQAMGVQEWVADRAERLGLRFPTEVQRRSTPILLSGSDAVIQSETGSGKTAAFLVPSLSRLVYPPDKYFEDMKGPQLLVLVPTFELGTQVALLVYKLYGGNISSQRPGDPANLFTYQGPRSIKVRGLLTDGDVSAAVEEPRWLQGAHVLVGTPPEVLAAVTCEKPYLDLSDLRVVVADEVDELMRSYPSSFRAILDLAVGNGLEGEDLKAGQAVPWPAWHPQRRAAAGGGADASTPSSSPDGADAAADAADSSSGRGAQEGAAAAAGTNPSDSSSRSGEASTSSSGGGASTGLPAKPQVVLVGATVTDAEVEEAVARHWVSEPVVVRVGTPGSVPRGLRHRALVVADAGRKLAALVAMLRRDLAQAGQDEEPARVIVFAASDAAARAAADPLRTALWSEHQLSVLLPSGAEPIKALQAFRDRAASLLLATPSASRGLDLPAVSHVYNLGPPADAKEYLHRAGRAGRIGSTTGGLVTSIVTPEELEALAAITGELGLALAVESEVQQGLGLLPGSGSEGSGGSGEQQQNLDALKRGLEDIFKLM